MYIEIRKNKQDAIWCYPDKRKKKKDMHHEMKRQIGLNSWRTHIKTGFWFHEHLNMANEQVNVSQGFDVIWIWFCLYQYQEITSFISFYSWGTEFLLKYFQSLPGRLINAILKDSLLENSTKELHFHKKMKNESEDPYETLKVLLKPGGRKRPAAPRDGPPCTSFT